MVLHGLEMRKVRTPCLWSRDLAMFGAFEPLAIREVRQD